MIVIGEKINASNKSVGQAIADKDAAFIQKLASDQDAAGADYIDVNAGAGGGSWESPEAAIGWLVEVVQSVTDKPLTLDSDTGSVIEAALKKYSGDTVMINSVNADAERLDSIGRLAAERGASIVALAMGEGAIPDNVEDRMAACEQIMTHLNRLGVKEEQVFFDPLVLPISVDTGQALVTLRTLQRIMERYPAAHTTMGLSNISYGLPNRGVINRAFLLMSVAAGLDSAILDPLDDRMMTVVRAGDLLSGKDSGCKAYIRAHRKGLLVA